MANLPCSAFWFSTLGISFLVFAFLAPFWFGRLDLGVAYYYALWYNLECFESDCTLYSDTLDSATLPLKDREWNVNILSIPVLVTIGLILALIALWVMEIMKCCTNRRTHDYHFYRSKCIVILCTVLFWLAGAILVVGCCVGIYAASEYYTDDTINHAAEFPWCLLSIIIGAIFIIIAAILYSVIICRWHEYGEHYSFRRTSWRERLSSGKYKSNDSRYGSKYGSNYKESEKKTSAYSVPAFSFPPLAISNSVGLSSSYVGKGSDSALARKYQQDKMRRTASEHVISRRSLQEVPARIHISEHEDYLDRLREERELNIKQTSSDYVTVHEPYYSAYSIPKSEPNLRTTTNEPNVLDILYRESRRDV